MAGGDYLTFTVEPKDGFQVGISEIRMGLRSNVKHTYTVGLFSSLDGFTEPLADGTIEKNSEPLAVAAQNLNITNQTGPIEFRIVFATESKYQSVGVEDLANVGGKDGWPDWGNANSVIGSVSEIGATN